LVCNSSEDNFANLALGFCHVEFSLAMAIIEISGETRLRHCGPEIQILNVAHNYQTYRPQEFPEYLVN
jgi:hypothetical protein